MNNSVISKKGLRFPYNRNYDSICFYLFYISIDGRSLSQYLTSVCLLWSQCYQQYSRCDVSVFKIDHRVFETWKRKTLKSFSKYPVFRSYPRNVNPSISCECFIRSRKFWHTKQIRFCCKHVIQYKTFNIRN